MQAYISIFSSLLLAGAEAVKFSKLPTNFIVDGAPATLTAELSEATEDTVEWIRDGKAFASADIDQDDEGYLTISDIHQSTFFETEFEIIGENVTTSVTINELARQFNGSTLAVSMDGMKSSLSTIVFPEIFYTVTVNVGSDFNDDIDVEISIVIIGDFGKTSPKNIGRLRDYVKAGGTRRIRIRSGSVGRIEKVKIGHREQEDKVQWYLQYLLLEDPRSGNTYGFPVGGTMSSLDNGEIYPGVTKALNTTTGDCEHPPARNPDFGIVGQNATVTRNCTSSDGQNKTCNATWGCHEMGTCSLIALDCQCQEPACGGGFKNDPNPIINIVITSLSFVVIKMCAEDTM